MIRKSASIFKDVLLAANRMGGCEPEWLKGEGPPDFKTVEAGSSGPNLILLHGLLGAVSNWESTLPLFGKFSRTVALHFPILTGHRSEVKVKSLAAYTEYFIRSRYSEPVVLCGNSLGGHVALRLALASPELAKGIVLSGASGLYEHSVDALPIRPDKKFVREHMARVFKNEKFITDGAVEEIAQIISSRANILNLIHAARSAKKDNLLRYLKDIKLPVLLLWGEDDEITTMQVAETFRKHLPNSTLVTKSNCGHAPMIEYPEWFAAEVQKFTDSL